MSIYWTSAKEVLRGLGASATWFAGGDGPDVFEGGMSTQKYASLAATSRATASRELIELVVLGLLCSAGAGRSTRYYINLAGWMPQAS
jgi:hypothetical protein